MTELTEAWKCLWRKASKRNKWDGDALLVRRSTGMTIVSENTGETMQTTLASKYMKLEIKADDKLVIHPYELMIVERVEDYEAAIETIQADVENSKPAPQPAVIVRKPQPFKRLRTSLSQQEQPIKTFKTNTLQMSNKVSFEVCGQSVYIDSFLDKHLQPHQVEGVKFILNEILQNNDDDEQRGCILADEMGLGKTLQSIALVWILLKQSPFNSGQLSFKRILIVCPSTLVSNWEREFCKWLTLQRLRPFTVGQQQNIVINDFILGSRIYPVMIISYDRLKSLFKELEAIKFDLMICDEGHKLKSASTQISQYLSRVECKRRLLLTGTPIQNNLMEFYEMVQFVKPGHLGSSQDFRRKYCQDNSVQVGEPSEKLMEAVEGILIRRRVKDIVARNLPPKLDITLVCRPEEEQRLLYDKVIEENREQPLVCVGLLTKVNNSPRLLSGSYSIGSKMKLLLSLVKSIVSHCPSERIVIVSHFTQTLDLIAIELDAIGLKFSRMDGSTCLQKRTEMIRRLNADYETDCNILLMSAKTGGVGTNLVGASRLIMFDISWNPVHDLQTSARLYRPGQKASCVYVYRLISAGMADEWIWQRQEQKIKISSITLEDTAADEEEDNDSNIEEFEVKMLDGCVDTSCLNHALSECHCDAKPPPELEYDQTFHIDTSINSDWLSLIVDKTLDSTVITNVTFAYVHKHSPK